MNVQWISHSAQLLVDGTKKIEKKDCPERETTLVQSVKFWQMRNNSNGIK